jgi:hypothetical protein
VAQANPVVAEQLRKTLVAFLRPFAQRLAAQLDIRLVQTALDLVQVILTHRHSLLGLLLSELGGYLLGPPGGFPFGLYACPLLARHCPIQRDCYDILGAPNTTEAAMEERRSEEIGDRRIALIVQDGDYYAVTIEVRGPAGWEDISLRADKDLAFDVASWRERHRVTQQQARALEGRKA